MKPRYNLIILVLCCLGASAQMPDTEIWLFNLKKQKTGGYEITDPRNISGRKGYDNQPCFTQNDKGIYFSSNEYGPTEIKRYDIKKKKSVRLSSGPESKYTPRPIAGTALISSIVVEKDSAQRLHFLNSTDGGFLKKLNTDSIGYYSFQNADTIVFYKLTDPHTLRWRTLNDSTERFLVSRPVRGFTAISRHEFIFGMKDSLTTTFYKYDFSLAKAVPFAKKSPAVEDIFWQPELGLLVSDGKLIEGYNQGTGKWEKLFDLSAFNLTRITRFAIDAKTRQLVVVDNPK